MRKGDNISVYLRFEFLEEIDEYALKNGFVNGDKKPNRSKALVHLAKKELDELNKGKRLIDKIKNGEKKRN